MVTCILALATVLRLAIALLNDAANDDHLRVVQLILAGRHPLTLGDCRECFHPKLFYFVIAAAVRVLGVATTYWWLRFGQVLDALFGVLVIVIVHRFLLRQRLSPAVRVVVVALVALNPAFLAINVQFTNDSLAILLSVAGVFAMTRYADGQKLRHFWLAAACLTLAFATKATAWVCGLAVALSLVASGVAPWRGDGPRPRRNFYLVAILAILLSAAIATSGYDFRNYSRYADLGASTRLHLSDKTYVGRPGVVSIYDSYLSFKLIDLLRHPFTSNAAAIVPDHRSSVFSQLYGRLHFLHLASWPKAWQLRDGPFFHVGRFNLVLGLVPTGLFLVGLGLGLRKQGARLAHSGPIRWLRTQQEPDLLCLLVCLGYLGFIVKFTYDFRDFSAMKPLYMFPGMLGFIKFLADGYQWAFERLERARRARILLLVLSGLLLAGYTTDVLVLAGQLVEHLRGAATLPR